MKSVEQLLQSWILEDPESDQLMQANALVSKFAEVLYCEYEPTRGPYPDFWQRLDLWLSNLDAEADQKLLFRLLPHLLFIGPREFDSLYRVAFRNAFVRWVIDLLGLDIKSPDLNERLAIAIDSTWFCPITDSMRINAFYHLNRLAGRDFRPDWRSVAEFGSEAKLRTFMTRHGIERLVLLEDFVGTGSQIYDAVKFAASLSPAVPVLVVPLVMCPAAETVIRDLNQAFPHVAFNPVLTLREQDFITDPPASDEPELYAQIRRIAGETFERLKAGLTDAERAQLYSPLGYGLMGALTVLYTNCPDNTLPLIHRKSDQWNPLFPRASRL